MASFNNYLYSGTFGLILLLRYIYSIQSHLMLSVSKRYKVNLEYQAQREQPIFPSERKVVETKQNIILFLLKNHVAVRGNATEA